MFKFDFQVQEDDENPFSGNVATKTECSNGNLKDANNENDESIEWNASVRVFLREDMLDNLDLFRLNATEMIFGDITLTYMITGFLVQQDATDEVTKTLKQDIRKAEESHSDLLPGIYEGGAKIWECTEDLLKYLVDNDAGISEWTGKRILDLGCGSGLLGLLAYKQGAIVEFQDYNQDVLERITMPNLLLNIPLPPNEKDLNLKKINDEIHFYSGDWAKYVELTIEANEDMKFDVILTSETIYNPQNQQKLLNTFNDKLKKNGIIYVAAKTYYFGVGGGLRQFEELIKKDNRFKSTVEWTAGQEGVSREIVSLKRL